MTSSATMPRDLQSGPGVREWNVWTTSARVVATDPSVIESACEIVRSVLSDVDGAANRFQPESEVSRIAAERCPSVTVSSTLAELIRAALAAAVATDGNVDPTMGTNLALLGYDRDLDGTSEGDADRNPNAPTAVGVALRRPDWRDVALHGDCLTMPAGILLDLGATAKAWAADRAAERVAAELGCGVMVSLGGDLRVAGPAPDRGWEVLVQDGADQPSSSVHLAGAQAIATSSTLHRAWRSGGRRLHHILDPATCRPATVAWRSASVAADTCVRANTYSTACIVRGVDALSMMDRAGLAVRFIDLAGNDIRRGGWPA